MVCWWLLAVLTVVQGVEVSERVSRRVARRRPGRRRRGRSGGPPTMRAWDVPDE